ncbi:MAG TPA: sigma 54-interacting transcriptional regulator [Selenomonadales bacterium]|nr:sigma 54-interacting transcriptional regulator [Selenomonadales bacterium]
MLVRDYMTPHPFLLQANETIKGAAHFFRQYELSAAPVIDEAGTICGILTASDLIRSIVGDLSCREPVKAVMTKNVFAVGEDCPLEEVRKLPYPCLPVVGKDNRVVGMITRRDLLNAYYTQSRRVADEVQALVGSAREGIIVVDASGVVKTYNDAAAKLIGMPAEEAIGRPIQAVIPNSGLRRVLDSGEAERDCQVTLGGRTILSNRSPIFEGRKVVGALAILQDTSALREVVTQLMDAQHHVEDLIAIFENARQGIIVVDQKGIICRVNKSYENTFNIQREDMLGRPVIDVIENTRLHIVAQTGIPEFGEIQKVKGRQIIVNRIPVFKNGKITGAIGETLFRDISEVSYLWQRLQQLERQVSRYQSELSQVRGRKDEIAQNFGSIVGSSRIMDKTKNLAIRASQADSNVLLLGESGTGKELFAYAIHKAGKRQAMPFITVNCAAIPDELLELELFGYDEGAFTGAKRGGKKGKFELADKGTLFLDEIGDMPLAMQAKILRALEDSTVDHIGGSKAVACDARIIAATNRPLASMVQQGTFREDLYYRLNVFPIHIPPLRDRQEDIGELIRTFLPEICQTAGRTVLQFAPEAMALLRSYGWPGNVRELINVLTQLAATTDGSLVGPRQLLEISPAFALNPVDSGTDSERDRIVEALEISRGNKVMAAKLLNCHRSTLYEKMRKYNL